MKKALINNNTFYMQYTALMLIIITFIIGSFLHPNFLKNDNNEQKIIEANVLTQNEILNIEEQVQDFLNNIPIYSKLFKEHNIKGELNINFDKKNEKQDILSLEDEIKIRFKNENINLKALNIFFKEGNSKNISFKILRTNYYDL